MSEDYYQTLKKETKKTIYETLPDQSKFLSQLQATLADLVDEIKKSVRPRYTSVPIVFKNVTVNTASYEILKQNYEGWLAQITFLSRSVAPYTLVYNQYSAKVVADGETVYSDSWTNFSTYYHAYMSDVAAFDDLIFYVLTFDDVPFDRNLKVELFNVSGSIVFEYIFIKLFKRLGAEMK